MPEQTPMRRRTAAFLFVLTSVALAARPAPTTAADAFVHPGGLHTQADFDRMKAKVAAGEHPWIDDWNLLIQDPKAQNTYRARPRPNMGVSRQHAQDDARSAYLNALRWRISGDTSYADCAVRNLNGWSTTVNVVPSGVDQPGLGGIPIGSFAIAAEVLRDYPGWKAADQQRFKTMLEKYFYPTVDDFLTHHRGTHPSNYWANWDTCNILALVAMGVYCDDHAKFDRGVEYYKNGIGMGSIIHAVPFLYPGGLGQWQESGRDHAHAFGGMGSDAEACQIAWNQGVDLFGYDDDHLLAGANYEARYCQWIGVPYTFYTNANNANQYYISPGYRGRLSNCEYYELLYNHYAVLKKRLVPDVRRFAELLRPEGGNVDLMGYGTLTFTLDAAASPYPASPTPPTPQDLIAEVGVGRVNLKWSPSGAYTTRGYEVLRAPAPGGPFTSVFSTTGNCAPEFTDTKVETGQTYYYAVAAINQSGTSEQSQPASATPQTLGGLPADWSAVDIGSGSGTSGYADVAGGAFGVSGKGGNIGGEADACHFAYRKVIGDFTLTARYIERRGPIQKIGLMMRTTTDPSAPTLAMTLGQIGGRQARFGTRADKGGKWNVQLGNDYTSVPVWFRLQRMGNTFAASQSDDGVTWHLVGKSDVAMNKAYLVGFAVSSTRPAGEPASAVFDHVRVEVVPPAAPAAPTRVIATGGKDTITLNWNNNSDGGGDRMGIRIEASADGKRFSEIASLAPDARRFVNTGVKAKRFYRVRACNTGGFSAYSEIVEATPQ